MLFCPQKVKEESTISTHQLHFGFEHGQRVAKMLASSSLIPKEFQGNIQNTMIALEMAAVLIPGTSVRDAPVLDAVSMQRGNTKMLGIEVYTKYLYPLQIAAVLLLVAIISAIALTLRRRKDSKYQDPSVQVRVRAADRMRVVKMQPYVEPPDPHAGAPIEKISKLVLADGRELRVLGHRHYAIAGEGVTMHAEDPDAI